MEANDYPCVEAGSFNAKLESIPERKNEVNRPVKLNL